MKILTYLLISVLFASGAAAQEKPYVFGIFPWARESLARRVFAPVVSVMAQELERPVVIVVPETYESFLEAAIRGDFSFVYSPVTMEHILVTDHGFGRIVAFNPPPTPFICTLKGAGITRVEELRGKRLGIMSELATASFLVEEELKSVGLDPEKDLTLVRHNSHENVLFSLLVRDVDAAVSTPGLAILLAESLWKDLYIVYTFPATPHTEILASSQVPEETQLRVQKVLLGFSGEYRIPSIPSRQEGYSFSMPLAEGLSDYKSIGVETRKRLKEIQNRK